MTAPASERRIAVGIGQLAVTRDANEVLVAYGLGSCVAVAMHDPAARVAGMVHVLLPSANGNRPAADEPARFADTGIDGLVRAVLAAGARQERLVVKAAGGASVLGLSNRQKFKIGERNAEAIKERLRAHGLRLAAEDLGGAQGRTFALHLATGRAYVRTATSPAREL